MHSSPLRFTAALSFMAGLLIVLLVFGTVDTARAAEQTPPAAPVPAAAPTAPTKAKIGLFVTQLYDFDMPRRSFNIAFWLWTVHNNPAYKPNDTVEITNAKVSTTKYGSIDPSSGMVYTSQKYFATMSQDWDVTNFPFDTQTLNVIFEDGVADSSQVEFVADQENSKVDNAIHIPGWTVLGLHISSADALYDTTFGDPKLTGTSTFSHVVAAITVKRNGLRVLCSMFIGFFFSFSLASLTYLLDFGAMSNSRLTLCAGATFAAIGNKYVVDNFLPPSSTFTLADSIQTTTFASIIVAILAIVVLQFHHKTNPQFGKRLNGGMGLAAFLGYFIINGLFILRAFA